MVMTVFAGIAEFERPLIHQRTSEGDPPRLSSEQIALGRRLIEESALVREAASLLQYHHATLYRALRRSGPQEP